MSKRKRNEDDEGGWGPKDLPNEKRRRKSDSPSPERIPDKTTGSDREIPSLESSIHPSEKEILDKIRDFQADPENHDLKSYFTVGDRSSLSNKNLDVEAFRLLVPIYQKAEAEYKKYEAIRAGNDAEIEKNLGTYIPDGSHDGDFFITFTRIGSGDCIFIKTPNGRTIVVDCGQRGSPKDKNAKDTTAGGAKKADKSYRLSIGDTLRSKAFLSGKNKKLHAIIFTHPDRDHYNEAVDIISNNVSGVNHIFFTVNKAKYAEKQVHTNVIEKATVFSLISINDAGVTWNSNLKDNAKWLRHYKKSDSKLRILEEQNRDKETICTIDLLAANVAPLRNEKGANSASVVTLITVFGRKILLCGDATTATEKFLSAKHKALITNVDLAQMEHHGSGAAEHAGGDFIKLINPQLVVASSGSHEGDTNPRWKTILKFIDPAEVGARPGSHRMRKDMDDHDIAYGTDDGWVDIKNKTDWKGEYRKYGLYTTHTNGSLCFRVDKDGKLIRTYTNLDKATHTYTILADEKQKTQYKKS